MISAWVALWLLAAPIAFESKLSADRVRLGEPFELKVSVTHPLDERYELEPPKDIEAFELLEIARVRQDAPSDAVTTFTVKLALFTLGKKTLPDWTFAIAKGDATLRWTLAGAEVEGVGTLPPDAGEEGASLHDIRPPEQVPVRSYRALYWLAALALLLVAAYGLVRLARRKRPPPVLPAPVPQPLDVRTLAALTALEGEALPAQGRFREYYFRLSEILRGYLGQRYRFEALECTSRELLAALEGLPTPGLALMELRRFAAQSDLAKFAKAPMTVDECKSSHEFAVQLVRMTTPSEPVTGKADELS